MSRPPQIGLGLFVALWCAALAGCYSLSQPVVETPHKPPFAFEKLGLPNDCFIESVRFHDAYLASIPEGRDRWVQLFQWGARLDDDSLGTGHSVAVFLWRGRLEYYDTNFGTIRLPVDPTRRNDIAQFAPPIYGRYPKLRPTAPMLMTDVWQEKRPALRGDLEPVTTDAHRQVLAAARELARVRETRVVRFTYLKDNVRVESAAAAFNFEGKVCVYVPEVGTILGVDPLFSINNPTFLRFKLARSFGREAKVELVTAK